MSTVDQATPCGQDPGEEAKRAPIGVVGEQDVVAGLQQVSDEGGGGHARGSGNRTAVRIRGDPFQCREGHFQGMAGGIVGAGVFVTAMPAGGILSKGAGGVDGYGHRSGGRIGFLPGVNGVGFEPHQSSVNSCLRSQSSLNALER